MIVCQSIRDGYGRLGLNGIAVGRILVLDHSESYFSIVVGVGVGLWKKIDQECRLVSYNVTARMSNVYNVWFQLFGQRCAYSFLHVGNQERRKSIFLCLLCYFVWRCIM